MSISREEENIIFHKKLIELREKKLITEKEFLNLVIQSIEGKIIDPSNTYVKELNIERNEIEVQAEESLIQKVSNKEEIVLNQKKDRVIDDNILEKNENSITEDIIINDTKVEYVKEIEENKKEDTIKERPYKRLIIEDRNEELVSKAKVTSKVIEDNINIKVKKESSVRNKLLTLGIVLISISAMIFATTTWIMLSGVMKLAMLLGASVVLLGVSKKFYGKIVTASLASWVIGLVLFPIDLILLSYLRILGNYFSWKGEGILLLLAVITFMVAGIIKCTDRRYNSNNNFDKVKISLAISSFMYLGLALISIKFEQVLIFVTVLFIECIIRKGKTNVLTDVLIFIATVTSGKYIVITTVVYLVYMLYKSVNDKESNRVLNVLSSIILLLVNKNPIILFTIILSNMYILKDDKEATIIIDLEIIYMYGYYLVASLINKSIYEIIVIISGIEEKHSAEITYLGIFLAVVLMLIHYYFYRKKNQLYILTGFYFTFFLTKTNIINFFYPTLAFYVLIQILFRKLKKDEKIHRDIIKILSIISAILTISLYFKLEIISSIIATVIVVTALKKDDKECYYYGLSSILAVIILINSININDYRWLYLISIVLIGLSIYNKKFLMIAITALLPVVLVWRGMFIIYEILVLVGAIVFLEKRLVFKVGFYILLIMGYYDLIHPVVKFNIVGVLVIMAVVARLVKVIWGNDKYYLSTAFMIYTNIIIILNTEFMFRDSVFMEFAYKVVAFIIVFFGVKNRRKDMVVPFFGFIVVTFFIDTWEYLNKVPWFIYLFVAGCFLVLYTVNDEINSRVNKSKNNLKEFIKLLK